MSIVHNEQTKLSATYLNGIALALMAVGFFAPVVSGVSGPEGLPPLTMPLGSLCVLASVALHLVARLMLRRMKE